jgi:hypothetical protein
MKPIHASDESSLTEIEIMPDGRIFLFGASRKVLEVVDTIQSGRDPSVSMRLEQFEQVRLAHQSLGPLSNHRK